MAHPVTEYPQVVPSKADGTPYSDAAPVPVTVVSGVSGTQYTEDAAAAADPVGTVPILVRRDTLSASEVTTDGDNIAQKGTSKGQGHIKDADGEVLTGGVTETAPATDTASSGLNGRLQRIAQRLTTFLAALGSSTAAKANVSASASSVTLFAANANARGRKIWNDSTAIMYLDESGGTASATSCTQKIPPDATYEDFVGCQNLWTAIWSAASGTARTTEYT